MSIHIEAKGDQQTTHECIDVHVGGLRVTGAKNFNGELPSDTIISVPESFPVASLPIRTGEIPFCSLAGLIDNAHGMTFPDSVLHDALPEISDLGCKMMVARFLQTHPDGSVFSSENTIPLSE